MGLWFIQYADILSLKNRNANTLLSIKLIKIVINSIINGDNVAIMHPQLVVYVMGFVLEFRHIYAYGAEEWSMVHVMEWINPAILGS